MGPGPIPPPIMTENQEATSANALMIPADDLERALEQIVGLLEQEFMPVLKDGFLINKRSLHRPRISKGAIKKVALKIQSEIMALSQLDARDPESRRKIWKFFSRLTTDIAPRNVRTHSKRQSNIITETIRSNEKILKGLKHTARMSQTEWQSILEAVVIHHHLIHGTGYEHHQFEYWKSRRIVSTFQAMSRFGRLVAGRWPQKASEKLSRLARIYGEAATVFEHMLRYHLEMLSVLPRPDGSRSPKPHAKATLGKLIHQAKSYPELKPLLVEVDVPLRNAIHHATYRIALRPIRLVWPVLPGNVEEHLTDFRKRVLRFVAVTTLFFMGQQIAGVQILAKVRYLLSGDTTDISKRFPNLYTPQCKVDPFPSKT